MPKQAQPTTSEADWNALATRVLDGTPITREHARAMLEIPDEQVLELLSAAYRIRREHCGTQVHLHVLENAQSGLCPEDCNYCSQSSLSSADIDTYALVDREEILEGARKAAGAGAARFCVVTSGRSPTDAMVDEVCEVVREIKAEHEFDVCLCMGILQQGQAQRMAEAGVDRYNHNLNTSERYTPEIVTTHTYEDRVRTVNRVKRAGISPCTGAIFGMGETIEDRVEVAFALRELEADSIPVNFLNPIEGTPLENTELLGANTCLKILAMMRFVNPTREIRIAGGREVQLGALQPLGLYAANSIFIDGYLTTDGQGQNEDIQMIQEMGFEVDQDADGSDTPAP